MATKHLVLRTVYIDPEVDDQLRNEAFDLRTSKNDLLREYLKLGMKTAKEAGRENNSVTGKVVVKGRSIKADSLVVAKKSSIAKTPRAGALKTASKQVGAAVRGKKTAGKAVTTS